MLLLMVLGIGCFAAGWISCAIELGRRRQDWRAARYRKETTALALQLAREQRRAAQEEHYTHVLKHINLAQQCARLIDEDD